MALSDAAQQAWPPFVLVTGLLLIGLVAHADGLFERAGRVLEQLPGPPDVLLAGGIVLVAVVTAVLNLDTAVVFLTPVLIAAARSRGVDEEPFLYASVFLANASSLFLPGSNLTNLLVLARDRCPEARSRPGCSRPRSPRRSRPRSASGCCFAGACAPGSMRTHATAPARRRPAAVAAGLLSVRPPRRRPPG